MRLQADGSKRRWAFNLTGMPQDRAKLLDSRLVGYTEIADAAIGHSLNFRIRRHSPRIGSYDTESNQKQFPPTRLVARFGPKSPSTAGFTFSPVGAPLQLEPVHEVSAQA